jgi:hypothetical protein
LNWSSRVIESDSRSDAREFIDVRIGIQRSHLAETGLLRAETVEEQLLELRELRWNGAALIELVIPGQSIILQQLRGGFFLVSSDALENDKEN